MDQRKVSSAVERLESNLPIRRNQLRLPHALRLLHQSILRYYFEHGRAPGAGDLDSEVDWASGVERLAEAHVIVINESGRITGAYPFIDEAREFRVIGDHGPVHAMCAFDALAVSSMFSQPTRIESRCRLTGREIVIEQQAANIRVVEPRDVVFAAIDWNAAAGASCCSATLCTEMIFIAGQDHARQWQQQDPVNRELFGLDEAHEFITTVFIPLMESGEDAILAG